jgi:hypothetical protein
MVDGARLYAAADRSDPFAFARALCHIRTGLCRPCEQSDMLWRNDDKKKYKMTKIGPSEGAPGHYDARQVSVGKVDALGQHYIGIDYMDIKRT